MKSPSEFDASHRFHVTVDKELIRLSIRMSQLLGDHALNQCSVCHCGPRDHQNRRGEIICAVHEISCSKELGVRIEEHRQRQKQKQAQAAVDEASFLKP